MTGAGEQLDPRVVWMSYLVTQLSQASRTHIPVNADAIGIEVNDSDVVVRFVMGEESTADLEAIDEIVWRFEELVGPLVSVETRIELGTGTRPTSATESFAWTFIRRPIDA